MQIVRIMYLVDDQGNLGKVQWKDQPLTVAPHTFPKPRPAFFHTRTSKCLIVKYCLFFLLLLSLVFILC